MNKPTLRFKRKTQQINYKPINDEIKPRDKQDNITELIQTEFNKLRNSLNGFIESKIRFYIDQRIGIMANGDELLTRGANSFKIAEDMNGSGGKSFIFNYNGEAVAKITSSGALYCRSVWLNGINLLDTLGSILNNLELYADIFVKHEDLKNGTYIMDIDKIIANKAEVKQELKINNSVITSTFNEEEQTEEMIINNNNTTFTGNITVDESATIEEDIIINGNATVGGDLTVEGDNGINTTTLTASGLITANDGITTNTLTASSTISTDIIYSNTANIPNINTTHLKVDDLTPATSPATDIIYNGNANFTGQYLRHLKGDLSDGAIVYEYIGKSSNQDEAGELEYFNSATASDRYIKLSLTGRSGLRCQNNKIISELTHYFNNGFDASGVDSYIRLSNGLYAYTPYIRQLNANLTSGNGIYYYLGKDSANNFNALRVAYHYDNSDANKYAGLGLTSSEILKIYKDKIEILGDLLVSGTATYYDNINVVNANVSNNATVANATTTNILTSNDGTFKKLTINDTDGIGDPFAVYSNAAAGCGFYVGKEKNNNKCATFHYDTVNNTFQMGIYGTAPDVIKYGVNNVWLNKPTTITNTAETLLNLTNSGQRYNKININGLTISADTYEGAIILNDIIEAVDYGGSNKFTRFNGRLNYFLSNQSSNSIIFGKNDDKGDSIEIIFNYVASDDANNNVSVSFWDYMNPIMKLYKNHIELLINYVAMLNSSVSEGGGVNYIFGKAINTAQSGNMEYIYSATPANAYIHLYLTGYSGLKIYSDYTESITPFRAPSISLNGSDLQTTLNNCAKLNAANTFTGYNTFNNVIDVWNSKIIAPNIEQVWNIKFYNDEDMIIDFKKMLHGYNDLGRVIYTTSGTYNNTLSLDINKSHSIIARVYSDGSNTSDYFTTIKHAIVLLDGDGKTILKDLTATNGAFTTSLTLNGSNVLTSASLANVAYKNINNNFSTNQTINGLITSKALNIIDSTANSDNSKYINVIIGEDTTNKNITFYYTRNTHYQSGSDIGIKIFGTNYIKLYPYQLQFSNFQNGLSVDNGISTNGTIRGYGLSINKYNMSEGETLNIPFGKLANITDAGNLQYYYTATLANSYVKLGIKDNENLKLTTSDAIISTKLTVSGGDLNVINPNLANNSYINFYLGYAASLYKCARIQYYRTSTLTNSFMTLGIHGFTNLSLFYNKVRINAPLEVSGDITVSSHTVKAGKLETTSGSTTSIGSNLTTAILNLVYPVGAVYISMNPSGNLPSEIAAIGTWESIVDRFLYCSGTAAGTTGGSKTHKHKLSANGWAQFAGHGSGYFQYVEKIVPSYTATFRGNCSMNSVSAGDNWGIALSGETDASVSTADYPPFMTCYAWRRTA